MMKSSPEISVIVPVYKVEKYLPQCLDSILAQTFTNFELLLIDDGSPDCCGEICEEYARKDKRIRVFHQENAGASCARNTGLTNSRGRYIAFVDSDDYVKARYLEQLYAILPVNESAQGVVVCGFDKYLPTGELQTVHVPHEDISSSNKYLILTDLINQNVPYAWSKLYDRQLIERHQLKFESSISCLEDLLFMLDYLLYADFVIIRDYNNYVYRVGYSAESLSVRINNFHAEYAVFSNFLSRVNIYQNKFAIEDKSLTKTWNSMTIFFHKVILSIYKSDNCYSKKERLKFLRQILSADKEWIISYFSPQYLVDKCGKYLLCHSHILFFDLWVRFLLAIKFKKRFGYK